MARARDVWQSAMPYGQNWSSGGPKYSWSDWLSGAASPNWGTARQQGNEGLTNYERFQKLQGSEEKASGVPGALFQPPEEALKNYASVVRGKKAPAIPNTSKANADAAQQRDAALQYARTLFGEEGARVLNATFEVENGWTGIVGDNGMSYGPLQFYGGGGQLNNFAAYKGIADIHEAGAYVKAHPLEAVLWALHNYYGQALQAGLDAGLRGPSLATYVQQHGQASVAPERAGAAYIRLYGPELAKAH